MKGIEQYRESADIKKHVKFRKEEADETEGYKKIQISTKNI